MYIAKLVAAVVGLVILVAGHYGLDLSQDSQLITDALVSIATALAVYFVPNKPPEA